MYIIYIKNTNETFCLFLKNNGNVSLVCLKLVHVYCLSMTIYSFLSKIKQLA